MQPSRARQIRLALIEDHTLVRLSLKALLNQTGSIQVVGDTGSAAVALDQTPKWAADVVLMDVQLPDGDGVSLCRTIREKFPSTQVLFLSAFDDERTLSAAAVGGAAGFLHKTSDLDEMIRAIHAVAAGEAYLDGRTMQSVISRLRTQAPVTNGLSPQEQRVMQLLTEGYTNKEIAVQMQLSDKTVKNYLSHIFEKLEVTRRSAAVSSYLRMRNQPSSLS